MQREPSYKLANRQAGQNLASQATLTEPKERGGELEISDGTAGPKVTRTSTVQEAWVAGAVFAD